MTGQVLTFPAEEFLTLGLFRNTMKLTCVIFVAFLAVSIPLAECRPAFELGGLGEYLHDAEGALTNNYRNDRGELSGYPTGDDDAVVDDDAGRNNDDK